MLESSLTLSSIHSANQKHRFRPSSSLHSAVNLFLASTPHLKHQEIMFLTNLFTSLLEWLKSIFFRQEMEVTVVGLQNSGKTTLVKNDAVPQDMIPTVGFNMQKAQRGRVTIKFWDLGGQPRFRSLWERYCRGVNVILFVVDAADASRLETAKNELHNLLDKPQLQNIPVLVLGNKNDLPEALNGDQLIEALDLASLGQGREISCYSISAKNIVNIDITVQWLIRHAKAV